jgi:hypothetical protein
MSRMLTSAAVALSMMVATQAVAQDALPAPAHDAAALAKQTQNPVAALVSVPFQFNFNGGGDLEDGTLFNLNFQPVIPFKLTPRVNVIARSIIPINSAPGPDGTRYSGVGDIQSQLFLTSSSPGAVVLGVGPVFSLPTATAAAFETGTFAAGLGAVVVHSQGPWVMGGLISQFWPVSDAGGAPETNLFTFQPFINYNFGVGWALSFAPVITANWDAPNGQEWTVPLGGGIVKTTVLNRRPMNVGFQYYRNVERPTGSAGQTFRFVVVLLYPQAPGR